MLIVPFRRDLKLRRKIVEFRKPRLEDKELLDRFYKGNKYLNCELTFTNALLWSTYYGIEYTIIDDLLVYKTVSDEPSFVYPIGSGDKKKALEKIMDYCREKSIPFRLHLISEEMFMELNEFFPNKFTINYDRDIADYIYLSQDLMKLSGKKYHGKKNHINKFNSMHQWEYENITTENIEECVAMAKEWGEMNHSEENESKQAEMDVTLRSLKHFLDLNLQGGLIRVDGKVIAFTIGEPVGEDGFVIHIEKAFSHIQGAYPMINQQFIINVGKDYKYINREEDMGVEGLRKAKLSYKPFMLLEKGVVTESK